MAVEVIVNDRKPLEIMDIVKELREQGYVQGRDFDFSYHASQFSAFDHSLPTRRYTVFRFYVEKYAILFTLKYGS